MIDWFVVPDFNNKMGRTGYSRRALLKAIFVQKVKGFTVRELIHFLKSNPSFAKCIGFDPIINYVPSEATFSSFKKEFGPSYLDKVIVFTVLKGIKEGIFDTSYLVADSYPIVFNSFFNNKKSHGKFKDYKEYYRSPLEANFGVKPVSNSKPIYDKYGNPKNAMSYLGYKAHTISFLNVPIFTLVFPASAYYKNYALVLLKKVVKYLDLSGFNFLADTAYDSSVEVEYNLSNLFLIASALLAHKMGRDDLLSSPKTLMYETAS